jgi:hypothetical protein
MANNLAALAPTLYSAAKEVAAEPFGVVAAINTSFDDKGVAKGDIVKVPTAPVRAASDFTPAATSAAGTDATATTTDVQITKSRKVDWNITGEQLLSLENGGTNLDWAKQILLQGMRTLRNEAEVDAALAAKLGASRAIGTAGTTPFGSDINLLVDARKILTDNGAPKADMQFIGDTAAEANMLKLGIVQQAQQAGDDSERRSGILRRQFGFLPSASAGIGLHTAGTGASATTNTAGYAVGATVITLASAGTGAFLPGDVITIAGDTNKYVVVAGDADVSNGGTITIAAPGLRKAIATSATNITLTASYTPNLAFERNAIVGTLRPPKIPANPTIKQMLVSDPQGMTYLMLEIAQYGMITWELHLAWGFKTVNPEFSALVLG